MKELKVIVLQGLPASGKTTWAKQFVSNPTNIDHWVRVNRDEIRRMMGKYWVPSRENYVSDVEETTVMQAIESGFNVIIDATNLNPKTITKWQNLVDDYNHATECLIHETTIDPFKRPKLIIEFKYFHITPEEAVKRDKTRGDESVGEKVIVDFWHKYIKGQKDVESYTRNYVTRDPKLIDAIIVDLDGTVALMHNRSPYDHSKVKDDLPNTPVIEIVQHYASIGVEVLFVSGRSNECYDDSRQWIIDHIWNLTELKDIPFSLYMRDSKDWRKDSIVKDEIYQNEIKGMFNILFVLDDRDQVVEYWRSQGLLCLQVYKGNF